VKNVIAVSSGKGGVGKSTVAVNLAYALAALDSNNSSSSGCESTNEGAPVRVGLLDADIHGPSLPVMVSPPLRRLREFRTEAGDSLIEPLVYEGVRVMSYGFVPASRVILSDSSSSATASGSGETLESAGSAAIMRGPMVAQLVNELATRTHWGELDYLVIDMPPGTGDVALTLTQNLKITGAVVVTTPQKLAFVDVAKGIELFDRTRVPVLGVVENMAYYTPPRSTAKHYLFGDSGYFVSKLRKEWGVDKHFQVPIVPQLARQGDRGEPFVLAADAMLQAPAEADQTASSSSTPAGEEGEIVRSADRSQVARARDVYAELARFVAASCTPEAKAARASLDYNVVYRKEGNTVALVPQMQPGAGGAGAGGAGEGVAELAIDARALRLACKCAACVHEWTGQPLLKPLTVPQGVHPKTITPRGQYAVAVTWSDGHQASMYPWTQLLELAGKK
jgi:Mrp family chromosome partitioning ATPase